MSVLSEHNIIFIKYFLIGDIDNNKIITEFSTNEIGFKEKKNAAQIFKRICKSNERRYEERNIISAKENKYYFSLFQPNIVFIIYADGLYPERLVFAMFDEIRKEKVLSMINEETKELNPNGRQCLKQIIEKYQEKEQIDKIESIQKDINDVKNNIKENVQKMVESVEDAEKLEETAKDLQISSDYYKNTSEEVRHIIFLRNCKFWIIIFFIFIILIILLLISIF
jgi:vesicle-associated membrane protein 8